MPPAAKSAMKKPPAKRARKEAPVCEQPAKKQKGKGTSRVSDDKPTIEVKNKRRDEVDQAQRAIDRKLCGYDQIVVNTVVGKTSRMSVSDYIIQEFRQRKYSKNRLATRFWTEFFREYDLGAQLFSKLPDADEDYDVDDMLVVALEIANESNPIKRSEQQFLRYVEYLQKPAELPEITGMIKNSLPNEFITQKMSRKMFLAILKHIGQHNLHLKHDVWWGLVREDFGVTVKNAWLLDLSHILSRSDFLESYEEALKAFMSIDYAKHIEACLKVKAELNFDELRAILLTNVGEALYRDEAIRLNMHDYVTKCKDCLENLEHLDFDVDECRNFNIRMDAETKLLVSNGASPFACSDLAVSWLTEDAEYQLQTLADIWAWRFAARVKELAVSYGYVKRLPWEVILFGAKDKIQSLPLAVNLPHDLPIIRQNARMRETLLEAFGDAQVVTFDDMRKVVSSKWESMKEQERTAIMEYDFIMKYVEAKADREFRSEMLNCLTREHDDVVQQLRNCSAKLDALLDHPALVACNDNLSRDYKTQRHVVINMTAGKPPPPALIANCSQFFKEVLKRLTLMCRAPVPGKLTTDLKQVHMYGVGAAKLMYNNLPKPPSNLNQVSELRRFEWLLTASDRSQLDTWVQKLVRQYRETHVYGATPQPIKDGEAGDLEQGGAIASSSSCEIVPFVQRLDMPGSSDVGKKLTPGQANKAAIKHRIQSLFRKGKKVSKSAEQ